MRDMACSLATIDVASCYIICSEAQAEMISSVNTRPTSASARLLRNGLLLLTALLLSATRRHSGTAAMAKTANIRICNCQDGLIANDSKPTSSAARPSQNKKTPGASSSSAIRTTPKISQFQVPSVENISVMV